MTAATLDPNAFFTAPTWFAKLQARRAWLESIGAKPQMVERTIQGVKKLVVRTNDKGIDIWSMPGPVYAFYPHYSREAVKAQSGHRYELTVEPGVDPEGRTRFRYQVAYIGRPGDTPASLASVDVDQHELVDGEPLFSAPATWQAAYNEAAGIATDHFRQVIEPLLLKAYEERTGTKIATEYLTPPEAQPPFDDLSEEQVEARIAELTAEQDAVVAQGEGMPDGEAKEALREEWRNLARELKRLQGPRKGA